MTKTTARFLGLIFLTGALLASCNKNNREDGSAADIRSDRGRVEDQFGKGFGEAFRADPNSEPANVSEGDMVPVSLTAEPVKID